MVIMNTRKLSTYPRTIMNIFSVPNQFKNTVVNNSDRYANTRIRCSNHLKLLSSHSLAFFWTNIVEKKSPSALKYILGLAFTFVFFMEKYHILITFGSRMVNDTIRIASCSNMCPLCIISFISNLVYIP